MKNLNEYRKMSRKVAVVRPKVRSAYFKTGKNRESKGSNFILSFLQRASARQNKL